MTRSLAQRIRRARILLARLVIEEEAFAPVLDRFDVEARALAAKPGSAKARALSILTEEV